MLASMRRAMKVSNPHGLLEQCAPIPARVAMEPCSRRHASQQHTCRDIKKSAAKNVLLLNPEEGYERTQASNGEEGVRRLVDENLDAMRATGVVQRP